MTDGEENDSKEFSGNDIKKLVEELKHNRWTFTYIGTDHDVEKIAISLPINNIMVMKKMMRASKKCLRKKKMQEQTTAEK